MKKHAMRIAALCLTVLMLLGSLTGCSFGLTSELENMKTGFVPTAFGDMEYTRPDMEALANALDLCLEAAQQEDFSQLETALYDYTDLYLSFCTNYFLSEIYYSADLTDSYWTEEYNFCLDATTEVEASRDELFHALAASPHRETLETDEFYGEDFFDDYDGESLWDENFTAMMDREADLTSQYYDLSAQSLEVSDEEYYEVLVPQICQVYMELVLVRQEIAEYAGFDSYPEYAYSEHYTRDYTPAQEGAYLKEVRKHLVPLYKKLATQGVSGIRIRSRDEEDTFAYVEEMAQNMDGVVLEAFELMSEYELYDITISENKFQASFEVYLYDYDEPYIFINPDGSDYDYLTFAHEFGHFCNDYASWGSGVSIDVAEIFSQGMEYLSLSYVDDGEKLATLKMVSSLCTYVEQSAYADFEQRVYALDPEDVTVDNMFAIFEEVCVDYGIDAWGLTGEDFVQITHFFTSPCYVFSYVVSNDAAMQLYQMEAEEPGSGLELYQENLDTEEECFLAFLESAGLESPFADGRIESVAEMIDEIIWG